LSRQFVIPFPPHSLGNQQNGIFIGHFTANRNGLLSDSEQSIWMVSPSYSLFSRNFRSAEAADSYPSLELIPSAAVKEELTVLIQDFGLKQYKR
jgi:hypothetical protein